MGHKSHLPVLPFSDNDEDSDFRLVFAKYQAVLESFAYIVLLNPHKTREV